MPNKNVSNPALVGQLAKVGINVKAGQPAAPGKAAQRAADFRAGVRYQPPAYRPVTQGPAQPPQMGGGPQLQQRLQGMGVRVPGAQPFTPSAPAFQQQQPYRPPGGQSFGPPNPMGPQVNALQQWQPQQSQGPAQGGDMQQAMFKWMAGSLWTLFDMWK